MALVGGDFYRITDDQPYTAHTVDQPSIVDQLISPKRFSGVDMIREPSGSASTLPARNRSRFPRLQRPSPRPSA